MEGLPMLKAWLNPDGEFTDLLPEALIRAARLAAAAKRGARFLALPTLDSRDAATWILASFHSPLAVVPISPALPEAARDRLLAQFPAGSIALAAETQALQPDPDFVRRAKSLKEIWAVIFTSGSSGQPKGIALTGSSLKAAAVAHAEHSQAGECCWLLDLPLNHIGGFSVISRAFFLNAPVALGGPRFDAQASADWISSGHVQGLSLVPTTLFRLLQLPDQNFSPLKLVLLGGAPCEPTLVEQALERGLPVRTTYGMTEHCSQIATERSARGGLEFLPHVEFRISGEGEISLRSPCLASGFFQRGKFSPLPKEEGFFATGDLAEWKDDRLFIRGRKSEMIISGGVKIFPAEVERELIKNPAIKDCVVAGLPSPEWGEILCAVLVSASNQELDPDSIKKFLAASLDPRKIPRLWVQVAELPRSGAGKPLRAEVRALAQARLAQKTASYSQS
jgi:O-succinylbenzoic acid--CoA ligase